ncbi:hypothetical protein PIB30_106566, partial [Stylosanthes scabra]|nr:hypothetical protein [Stylosanthes scabra]
RMQGNNSQGSRCSSRSRSHSSWVRTSSRGRVSKVPQWCGCGLRPVLRWSGTEQNPDRPFYGCPNYNVSGFNLFDFILCNNHLIMEEYVDDRPLGRDGVGFFLGQMRKKMGAWH